MAVTDNTGRVIYFEPNSLASQKYRFSNHIPDNISWNMEDLSMDVDLQIIIPSRADCGSFDYEENLSNSLLTQNLNETKYKSLLSGTYLKDNKNQLTDSYTDACYTEISRNGVRDRECLGIKNIDITFNSDFYPIVKIKFIDVRGYSLIMPQEQEEKTGKEYHSFFRSIFNFPYPKFILSVKGFYGSKVNFILSVRSFNSNLNPTTGNFEVDIEFIGHMYGLYKDIPMSFLFVAPFIGGENGTVNKYWKEGIESGRFVYNDGTQMKTFIEYLNNYKTVSNNVETATNNDSSVFDLSENEMQVNALETIKSNFEINLGAFKKKGISVDGNNVCVIFTDSSEIVNDCFSKTIALIKDYNKTYKGNIPYPNKEESSPVTYKTLGSLFQYNDGLYSVNKEHSIIQYLNSNGETKVYNLIRNAKQDLKNKRCYLYNKNNLLTDINDKLNELRGICEFNYKGVSKAQVDSLTTYLGFIPSVENIFRMLFAHLDCFMSVFYNTLNEIKQCETNGKRTAKALNLDLKMTDMPLTATDDSFIPPFPFVYNNINGKRRIVYPNSNLIETKLAEALLDGAKNGAASIASNKGDNSFNVVAVPLTTFDYFYGGKNPYNVVFRKANDDGVTESLMLFIYRLLFKQQIDATTKTNDIKSEAYNFYLTRKKITDKGKAILNSIKANDTTGIKELLSTFFDKNNPQVVAKLSLSGNKISYADDNIPIYIDSVTKKTDNTIFAVDLSKSVDFVNTNTISSYKGLMQISESSRKSLEKYEDDAIAFANKVSEGNGKDVSKFINLKLTDSFYYPTEGNNRIYAYDGQADKPASVVKYSKAVATQYAKDMFELKNKIDNENYTCKEYQYNYVECGWHNSLGCNLFDVIINQLKPTFTANESKAEKVLMFLASLPIGSETMKEAWNNLSEKNIFTRISKPALLYFGGLVYRYRKSTNDSKLLSFLPFPTYTGIRVKGDIFKIDVQSVTGVEKSYNVSKLDTRKQKILMDYFQSNVNSLYSTFIEPLYNLEGNYDKYSKLYYIKHGDKLEENLIKFILSVEYVNVCNLDSFKKTITLDDVNSFVTEVLNLYEKDESTDESQTEENKSLTETIASVSEVSDLTETDKLSAYCSLKTLYDKWLASYSLKRFKLHTYNEDLDIRNKRFANKQIPYKNISEFNNFLFVDSFYNDISNELMINPIHLYNGIKEVAEGKTQKSLLTMMQEIASKNNLRLLSLPVYNNLLTLSGIQNAFTPSKAQAGVQKQMPLSSTYVCMYTHEPSSKIDAGGSRNVPQYTQNGFDMADTNGEITPVALSMFRQPLKENELNARVVAFGVTYGKQNQMYFKDINIDMHEPKISDAGIQNLLQLANGGTNTDRITTYATGQDMFSIYSNKSYECSVTMLGCMDIMPMMYFQLNNTPLFKGAYIVQSVKHSITAGSIMTTFTGVRVNKTMLPFNKNLFSVNSLVKSLNIQYPSIEMEGYLSDGCVCPPCDTSGSSSTSISLVNGDRVVYIGDSQVVVNSGAMPKAVADGLGITIEYFGRGSARADHYLNAETENKASKSLSAPYTNMGMSKCNEVYNAIMNNPPKYIIIALGHNGATGLKEIISNFQSKGIKVIVIYMFHGNPKKVKGKMKAFTSEESVKLYEGIHGDIDVNIINLFDTLPGGQDSYLADGVHANKKGHEEAGKEIARQLKGKMNASQTSDGNNQNTESLATQQGCNCDCNPDTSGNTNTGGFEDTEVIPFKGSADWSKITNVPSSLSDIVKYVNECNSKYGTAIPPQILLGINLAEYGGKIEYNNSKYAGPFGVGNDEHSSVASKYNFPSRKECEDSHNLKILTYVATITIHKNCQIARERYPNFSDYDILMLGLLNYNAGPGKSHATIYGSRTAIGMGYVCPKGDNASCCEVIRRRLIMSNEYNDGKKGEISSYPIECLLTAEYYGGAKYPYLLWYYNKGCCNHGSKITSCAKRVGRENEVFGTGSF